jgi:hypothetical protein
MEATSPPKVELLETRQHFPETNGGLQPTRLISSACSLPSRSAAALNSPYRADRSRHSRIALACFG